MAAKKEGKAAGERILKTLLRDDEHVALASLSSNDLSRIRAGESVETDTGFIFSLAGECVTVGASTMGTIVARRKSVARAAAVDAGANAAAAVAALNAKLKECGANAEIRRAVRDYGSAMNSYIRALAEIIREVEGDRARTAQLAVALPTAIRGAMASEKARSRHRNDPKSAAKAGALALWQEREAGKHPKLRTEDQFAIEVCRRWPVLTSIGVVKKWSTAWRAESRRERASHGK